MANTTTTGDGSPAQAGIPFTIGAQACRYFSNTQTKSNFGSGGVFDIVPLAATGWIRSIEMLFTATFTTSVSAALVSGTTGLDAPWNLIQSVQLSDAQGKPIMQPISGYNLMLVNKWMPSGGVFRGGNYYSSDPRQSSEYALSASGTSGTAVFRLRIDLEVNEDTGYGCIPNLDSNASPQLKVLFNQYSNVFTGGTPSAATISMRTTTHFWSPAAGNSQQPVLRVPPGAGDYLQTRYETGTLSASTENVYNVQSKGGYIKGALIVSRNAGTRVAFTAGANVGTILDNQPIDDGVPLEEILADVKRFTGYTGSDAGVTGTPYTPLSAGTVAGADVGVIPVLYYSRGPYNDGWLNTLVGSSLQHKLTPGASATGLEVITQLVQPHDFSAFFARS